MNKTDQYHQIEAILEKAGPKGVHRAQCAAEVKELHVWMASEFTKPSGDRQ